MTKSCYCPHANIFKEINLISTKMKEKTSDEKAGEQTDAIVEKEYLGRIQPSLQALVE